MFVFGYCLPPKLQEWPRGNGNDNDDDEEEEKEACFDDGDSYNIHESSPLEEPYYDGYSLSDNQCHDEDIIQPGIDSKLYISKAFYILSLVEEFADEVADSECVASYHPFPSRVDALLYFMYSSPRPIVSSSIATMPFHG